jgi:hypothetical protein
MSHAWVMSMSNHSVIRAVCTCTRTVAGLPENVSPAKYDFENAMTVAGSNNAK